MRIKNMVQPGRTGMVFYFFKYGGKHSAAAEECDAEDQLKNFYDIRTSKSFLTTSFQHYL